MARHPGRRAPLLHSRGPYVVSRGTGRRRQEAGFGCAVCADLTVAEPRCTCRRAAIAHARLLGPGATVIRGEAAIHLEP